MNNNKTQKIERPLSLTDIVVNQLRLSIMEGDLALGESVSETMLAKKYGVSKTPVREALFRLKQEGAVEVIPQKGSFIYLPTPQEANDLCEFRAHIEPLALQEAFATGGDEFLDEIEVIVTKMKRMLNRQDVAKYLRLDTEFHQTFFNHCRNPYLKETYKLVSTKAAALRSHMSMNMTKANQSNEHHIEIVALLNEAKIDQAITLLKKHIIDIKEEFTNSVS